MRRRAGRGGAGVEFHSVHGRSVARRLLSALVVVVVAAVAATAGGSLTGGSARAGDGPVEGFAMWPNFPLTDYQRVAASGANTIYLDVYWQADSPDANSVHPQDNGAQADAALVSGIQNAKAAGLRVALMPKIWCKGCQYGWRGDLQPTDPDAFMRSYTQMVVKYAQMAQQYGVWLLFLGSEMNHLQPYTDDWRATAAAARGAYHGLITYQPNWDSDGTVSFWDALDLVTVSAYFPLTPTPQPSVAELKQAWHSSRVPGFVGQNWFAQLQSLASSTGKQVLIGEVGYRSTTTGAEYPWDEWSQATVDQATQANAYQALLETFSPQPWWMGVIWWQWRGTDADSGGPDMTPKGKQAEQLLTKWWAQGWRPASGSTTTAGGGGAAGGGHTAVLGARNPGTQAGTSTTGATSTSAADQPGAQAASGPALAGNDGPLALPNGPRAVARLAGASNKRSVAAVVALVAVLLMAALWLTVGLRKLQMPRRPLVAP